MNPLGHKKLAKFISKQFPFLESWKKELIRGSIEPDKVYQLKTHHLIENFVYRWKPHHFGRENDIENFLYKARRNFLKGKMDKSCYFLGYALHFIADAAIYSPGLYPVYKKGRGAGLKTYHARKKAQKLHQVFEKEISQLNFESLTPFFVITTPLKIKETVEKFLYKDAYYSPSHTLHRIYHVAFALTEICFRDPKTLHSEEGKLLQTIPSRKIEWLSFILFIVLLIVFSLFYFSSFWTILLLIFFSFPLGERYVFSIKNPWKLEGWYKKKISIFGLSKE